MRLCFPDNCKKMGLVFDHVVGIVEIINCKDVKIQVCVGGFAPAFPWQQPV